MGEMLGAGVSLGEEGIEPEREEEEGRERRGRGEGEERKRRGSPAVTDTEATRMTYPLQAKQQAEPSRLCHTMAGSPKASRHWI